MRRRITLTTLLIAAAAILISNLVGVVIYRQREVEVARTTLQDMLSLLDAQSRITQPEELLAQYERAGVDERLTVIGRDGAVLVDSEGDPSSMPNHSHRPEVEQALASGWGEDQRSSETTGVPTLYVAKRLTDSMVARLAYPLSTVYALAWNGVIGFIAAGLAALVLASLLAARLARRELAPLDFIRDSLQRVADGQPRPEGDEEYQADDELRPILRYIDRLVARLAADLDAIRAERDKTSLVLDCMGEGLVLLDREGGILAINRAARAFLDIPEDAVGSLLLLTSRQPVRQAIQAALGEGTPAVLDLPPQDGRWIRLFLSPVADRTYDGAAVGLSLLFSDVTQVKQAEAIRSDFTANVSHELKTPLTSIKGFSDMLSSGMVTEEADRKRFLTMIGVEADRLIALINDILELSELEAASIPQERGSSDLLAVARSAAELLAPMARERGISLSVEGEACLAALPEARLKELILNLAENALKYNREGGSVTITSDREGSIARLTVADTGIGIPEECQGRVFERFYRVDKGRSRQSGGTGLGLAIVKHITALYGGTLRLTSAPGRGTTIVVLLPPA